MSLRTRLFLGIGGLVALLVLAEWWWVQSLARALPDEVGEVAATVGTSMVSEMFFLSLHRSGECPEGEDCEPKMIIERHLPAGGRTGAEVGEGSTAPGSKPRKKIKIIASDEDETRVLDRVSADHLVFQAGNEDDDEAIRAAGFDVEVRVESGDDDHRKATKHAWSWLGDGSKDEQFLEIVSPEGGVRRIPIPDQGLREKLEAFRRQLLWGSAAFLAVGLLLAALVAQRVSAPLRRLAAASREVGEGELGVQVPGQASGEEGEAIEAFNRMSERLRELDAKNRELRARQHLGEIGEIGRGLAHTLRNPLNALGLSVEELAARSAGDSDDLALQARRQIRRLDRSIRSFLALASQGGGAATTVAPGELLQDVALEALQDGRGGVRLEVAVDPETPELRAVEPELRAVLQALLVNAVEASPAGASVRLAVEPAGESRVRIEIEDDGPGLPPEVRERLFTPHLTTKANGSGMGLFLAHRIATTRYDGRLELADRDEGGTSQGTRVILELGSRRAAEEADDD